MKNLKLVGLATLLAVATATALVWLLAATGTHSFAQVNVAEMTSPAQAHPVWTDFDISNKDGAQRYPAVASNDERGSSLVVWQNGGDFAPWGVSGKLVSWAGHVFSETEIFTSTSLAETWPDVAFNGYWKDRYMVVWSDAPVSISYPEIYGQLMYTNGALISGTFRIDDDDDHYDFYPAIANDTVSGTFMVVWNERWQDSPQPAEAQVSGRVMRANGTPLGDVFQVGHLSDYNELTHPALAYNYIDRQYLVVWGETVGTSGTIKGQIVANDGTLVGGSITLGTYESTELGHAFPDVAYDGRNNQYLIVWHDNATGDHNIYARLISSTGGGGVPTPAICTASGDQMHPAIVYNQQRSAYLVTWDDYRASNKDIYGQWVQGRNSALLGDNILILAEEVNLSQSYPAVDYNAYTRGFMLAWQDGSTADVHGMRLTGLPYDLSIHPASLWFGAYEIHAGDTVTIGAYIFDRFGPALNDVDVEFYHGDPDGDGTLIGSNTVSFDQGQIVTGTTSTWDTTGLSGRQTLYVVVDPKNQIPEMLEGNNVFSRTKIVRAPGSKSQPPTCTLTINGGAQATHDAQVNLTITVLDDGGSDVRAFYLREWWAAANVPGVETIVVGEPRGAWVHRDLSWQSYDPVYASAGYSYTLNGTPGIRYVQVWCINESGAVSIFSPARDAINLVSPYAWTLADGEWHLYRMQWPPGASVAITTTVVNNDVDLLVWSPGITRTPDLSSTIPGPDAHTDEITFTAQAGVYQIMAYGVYPYASQYSIEWQAEAAATLGEQPGAPAGTVLLPGKETLTAPPIDADQAPPAISAIPDYVIHVYLPLVVRNS